MKPAPDSVTPPPSATSSDQGSIIPGAEAAAPDGPAATPDDRPTSVGETAAPSGGQAATSGGRAATSGGRARTVLISGLILAAVLALVIWQRQRLSDMPGVLGHAKWEWILAAIACQAASIGSLARLQRRLLGVDGVHRPLRPILATTYAGNAISQSLPVVGSAASALFAYRRFLTFGADKVVAGWALAVAGLYSTITFVALSAVGALLTGSVGAAVAGLATLLVGVLPAVLLLTGLHKPAVRHLAVWLLAGLLSISQRLLHKPAGQPTVAADEAIGQVAELRLTRRDAMMAGRFALLNWTSDVACLLCALLAVGAPIPWHGLLLAWAAGTGVSTLGLTPGGLGVVEAALSVALIAAGLPAGIAVSGVLLYRFVKLWLVIAAGAITLLVIRGRRGEPPAQSASAQPSTAPAATGVGL